MRRKMEQLREELELTDHLRDSIENRLKVDLPEDLGSSLMDGVVLCHLANQIRPRSVGSIHVPPAVSSLCSPYDIIQSRLQPLSVTVQALVPSILPLQTGNRKWRSHLRTPPLLPLIGVRHHSDPAPFLADLGPDWLESSSRALPRSAVPRLQLERAHDKLCLPHHILEEKGLVRLGVTVHALLEESLKSSQRQLAEERDGVGHKGDDVRQADQQNP
ncbi:hypothetical protein F7725_002554 [Dissostichus mawsoni]|uniref:Calponin-homology (CH) domain-containing protein n=1 Tax=Dissostichus mawsoni TaxID=36200 RepID=A0A7J5Y2P5_DISMA|nr:hypothetical protein F7725_002554 [Dissostichus mawsoni]